MDASRPAAEPADISCDEELLNMAIARPVNAPSHMMNIN